jgi:peptide subunit release factor 1 (eRF1)
MLDELLGRAALKRRIEELEDEKRRLRERYDSADERRAEAESARQDAERRVNRLEDRIADLEGRVERADADERDLSVRRREPLRGDRLDAVLDRLDSVDAGPEGALTAYVPENDDLPASVGDAFGERAALVARARPCLALTDDAGVVSAALRPPLPPAPFDRWDDGFRLERSWFRPTGRFAFALVRSDLFALGEYDGSERTHTASMESDVMGAHSKGGFSQARFERRRDQQIDDHLRRCREALADRDADRLVVVGERTVLGEFASLADRTATVDATGDPEEALSTAFREFWTTRLFAV